MLPYLACWIHVTHTFRFQKVHVPTALSGLWNITVLFLHMHIRKLSFQMPPTEALSTCWPKEPFQEHGLFYILHSHSMFMFLGTNFTHYYRLILLLLFCFHSLTWLPRSVRQKQVRTSLLPEQALLWTTFQLLLDVVGLNSPKHRRFDILLYTTFPKLPLKSWKLGTSVLVLLLIEWVFFAIHLPTNHVLSGT